MRKFVISVCFGRIDRLQLRSISSKGLTYS